MTPTRQRPATDQGLQARRVAMLALFEDEFRPEQALTALERLASEKGLRRDTADQARDLVEGVLRHRPDIDAEIARLAPAIPVSELGRVERTILRSALYEVLYSAAIPDGETIHDAVSLARTYAGDAARRLVNGVLGSVARSTGSGASGRGA